MRVAFVDPTNYVTNYGLRVLAAHVAQNGHEVVMVFLPPGVIDAAYDYPESVYADLDGILQRMDIVGLSFVSNYYPQACAITQHIKRTRRVPVVWGGIHATAKPQESLEYADMVCVGEGEDALLELLGKMEEGKDVSKTPNFWYIRPNRRSPIPRSSPYTIVLTDEERALMKPRAREYASP